MSEDDIILEWRRFQAVDYERREGKEYRENEDNATVYRDDSYTEYLKELGVSNG